MRPVSVWCCVRPTIFCVVGNLPQRNICYRTEIISSTSCAHSIMTSLLPPRLNHIASFAIVALLSACGGGGGGDGAAPAPAAAAMPASPSAPAAAPAPAAAAAPAPILPAVVAPSDLSLQPVTTDAADSMTGAYTLLPATAPADSGGEAPYPDLRMLPTRIMPFQPVAFGNVSAVAVTSAN
jgi:hypothetical protein